VRKKREHGRGRSASSAGGRRDDGGAARGTAASGDGDGEHIGHVKSRREVHSVQHLREHLRGHCQVQAPHHAHRQRSIRHRLVPLFTLSLSLSRSLARSLSFVDFAEKLYILLLFLIL
jgi:hypothetical protein